MKRVYGVVTVLFATVFSAVLISLDEEPAATDQPPQLIQAVYEDLAPAPVRDKIVGHGQVRARWSTTLASEVSGRVVGVADSFQSGLPFAEGDILVRLESSTLVSALANARASLSQARRTLLEEEQRARIARGSWSSSGMEGEASALTLRRPQLEEARARVVAGEAEVKSASYNLSRAEIDAPYDGVVVERLINPGDFLQAGTPIGRIFDRRTFEVVVPLTASEVARMDLAAQGLDVTLRDSTTGKNWQGTLSRVEQTVDEQNRWRNVIVEVVETEGLSPGQFVEIEFFGRGYEDTIRVRERHLGSDGSLWLIDRRNVLQRVQPTIVFSSAGYAYIQAPLEGHTSYRVAESRDVFLSGITVKPVSANESPRTRAQVSGAK